MIQTQPFKLYQSIETMKDFPTWIEFGDKLEDYATPHYFMPMKDPKAVFKGLTDPPEVMASFLNYGSILWEDYDKKIVNTAPAICNFDSFCYNPENCPEDRMNSWGVMFDREWKGKVAIQDVASYDYWEAGLYLVHNKMMPAPKLGVSQLGIEDIDTITDFFIKVKKTGQFRAFWTDYGELVSLLAAGEVWIGDIWQPGSMDTRRKGTPNRYAVAKEGYRGWFGGDTMSNAVGPDMRQFCTKLMDWHSTSGWFAQYIQRVGYSVSFYKSPLVKKAMGPEYWGWAYGGQSTYKPVPKEEQGTFVPEKYEWSMEEGTPDPNGSKRDCGSIEERTANIGMWESWPDNADYMLTSWEKVRRA